SRPVQRQSVDVGSELVLVVEHLVARDDLARVGGHAAHGGDQTGFGAAPDLVVGLILANRSQEVVPLQLIGIGLLAGGAPDDVGVLSDVLAAKSSGPARSMAVGGDDRRAARAVGIAGELILAAGHGPPFKEELAAVGEGEFGGVAVEVLVDVVAAK